MSYGLRPYGTQPYALLDTPAAGTTVTATLAATLDAPTFSGDATVAVAATLAATLAAPTFTGAADVGAPAASTGGGGPARKRRTSGNEPLGNRSHANPRRNSRHGDAEEEMAETLAALRPGAQIRVMPNDDETDDEEAILWMIH